MQLFILVSRIKERKRMVTGEILHITGFLLTITGIFDAVKYHWSAAAIRKARTAKGQSRKFINAAILNDIIRIIHVILIPDWYLLISSLIAIVFMLEHYLAVYQYYPYKTYPKNKIIQKPNIFRYIWNSLLPNRIRKKL